MQEQNGESAMALSTPAGRRIGQINVTLPAAQSIARTIRNAVLVASALVIVWLSVNVLLVVFAGILLAIFLRGLADAFQNLAQKAGVRLPTGGALVLVIFAILLIGAAIGWFFNDQIASQVAQLSTDLPHAFHNFLDRVRQFYWGRIVLNAISPAQIASTTTASNIAGKVAITVFGVAQVAVEIVASIVVFFFVGLYGAAEPGPYARGVVALVRPANRPRAHHVLRQTTDTLWYWEMGRLFSMTTIGLVTGVGLWLLGVPAPGALGLLAGLLTFVPYAGTIISAIPAALLAFTISSQLALYTVLLYVGAHTPRGLHLGPAGAEASGASAAGPDPLGPSHS